MGLRIALRDQRRAANVLVWRYGLPNSTNKLSDLEPGRMKTEKCDRGGPDGQPLRDDGCGKGSPHPLDEWLRRELGSLFSSTEDDPLPPDLADLAGKLEQALTVPRPRKPSD